MFVLTLSFWTMRHPKCRCSGIASYQGRFVPNAGLILSGAKSKISPDVRHAATAVLMKVFSAPELMRNVERIIKKELPKSSSN